MSRWFVVHVHTGCELPAASAITDLGLRAIAPRLRQRRKEKPGMTWRQKQAIRQNPVIEVSLFPGYILAAFDRDRDDWGQIKRLDRAGIIGVVPVVGERPAPLPEIEAERLLECLDDKGFWVEKVEEKPWQKFEVGQLVRIADGPFTSYNALVEMSEDERIKVLLKIMGRETSVELNWDQVEAL